MLLRSLSTPSLCSGAKIFYIKVGFKGVYFSWTCFPDGLYQTRLKIHPNAAHSYSLPICKEHNYILIYIHTS